MAANNSFKGYRFAAALNSGVRSQSIPYEMKFLIPLTWTVLVVGCWSEDPVVLAQMTADQRIIQVEARGFTEAYALHLVMRDNSGKLIHDEMIVSNIDMPGDFKAYVADLRFCGDHVQLDVLDIPFVQQIGAAFVPHVQMRRLPESEYHALIAGEESPIHACMPSNSFKGMPLRGTP